MNKKKFLISIVFSLMVMLVGIRYVKAEEVKTTTAFLECEYRVEFGNVKDNSKTLRIGYTEILDEDGNNFYIQGRIDEDDYFFGLHEDDPIGYWDLDTIGKGEFATYNTFQTAYIANDRKCPTYLAVEYREDGPFIGMNYDAKFYNNIKDSKVCNDSNNKLCKLYLKLSREISRVDILEEEDLWHNEQGESWQKYCNYMNLDMKVSGKKLKAKVSYNPTLSSCLDCIMHQNNNYITMGGLSRDNEYDFRKLYQLFTIGKLSNQFAIEVNPSDTESGGKEYVDFISSGNPGSNICHMYEPSFTKVKLCKTASELNNKINELSNQLNGLIPDISDLYESPLYTNGKFDQASGGYKRVPRTFKIQITLETLNNIIDTIGSIKEVDSNKETELLNEIESLINGDGETSESKACKDAREKLDNVKKEYLNKIEQFVHQMEVLKESAQNAMDRAKELEADPEMLEHIQSVVDELGEKIERVYKVIKNLEITLLDSADFNLGKLNAIGCDILSSEMVDFLDTVLWYIRIAGVVLAIILSLVDYIKATMSSEDKSISAVNKKFVTRIILVAVLFLVPVLLDFLLKTLNISTTAGSLACVKY